MIHPYIHLLPHYAAQPSLPSRIAQAYQFPLGTGAGATVGIVELGGGYKAADIDAYLKQQGLPTPSITDVSIDGGANAPGGDADAEV